MPDGPRPLIAQTALIVEPRTLTSHAAELTLTFATGAPGAVVLELAAHASPTLLARHTTLTITIDDVPVTTLTLDALRSLAPVAAPSALPEPALSPTGPAARTAANTTAPRSLKLPAVRLPTGFHRVRFVARLETDNDECTLPDPALAWLVLDELSAEGPAVTPQLETTIAAILAHARATTQPPRIALAPATEDQPAPRSLSAALAYLDADQLLRSWGATPVRAATTTAAPPTAGPPADTAAALRVLWPAPLTVSHAVAEVSWDAQAITVAAANADDARAGLAALADQRFVAECQAPPCGVAGLPTAPHAATATQQNPLALFARHPTGLTVRGAGTHRVRWTWARPPGFHIESAPILAVHVAFAASSFLPAESSVEVAVNGRPLATYTLDHAEAGRMTLRTPLPTTLWAAPEWNIELALVLTAPARQACSLAYDGWFTVDPATALDGAWRREEYDGIADWLRVLTARPALGVAPSLTWKQWQAAAAPLAAIGRKTPYQPWRVDASCLAPSEAGRGPTAPCVAISLAPATAQLPALAASARALSRDWQPIVLQRRCQGTDCARLQLVIPEAGVDEAITSPELSELRSESAIWVNQSWRSSELGAAKRVVAAQLAAGPAAPPASTSPTAPSRQLRNQFLRDLIWAAAGIALLAALFWRFRRN